jgi:peptide/nickel transport system permease protein
MLGFVARRLLYSIPVLLAASALIFFAVSTIGDPLAALRQNPLVSRVTLEKIEQRKHLNEPIPVQYGYWLKDAVMNRFGTPLLQPGNRIWDDLKRVLPHTFQLVLLSEVFALAFGIGIGVYSAVRQYSLFDYAATVFSFLGFAVPAFWLALMLQTLFTNVFLRWHVRIFYTSGLNSPDPGHGIHFWVDRLQHLALPAMTLALLTTFARHARRGSSKRASSSATRSGTRSSRW